MPRPKKSKRTRRTTVFSGQPAPVSPTVETISAASSSTLGSADRPTGLGDRRLVFGICVFLAALVWLVFGRTVHYAFVNYDDSLFVYENPAVTGGLSRDGVKWAFTHTVASNWHPLTTLSHMLDCQLYGLNAGGHHLTNVLLHTASVILLFLVLRQMTGKLWRSALVAAVFAIHPLRVESVAWVSERKDVLSGLFFMLTLWAYVYYARRPFSLGRYLCVVAPFALGLLSKPMVVTLPFVLLLLDYWPLGRFQWTTVRATLRALRSLFCEKIPLFFLAAVLSVVTFIAQKGNRVGLESMPVTRRLSNVMVSYGTYVREMVWPQKLAAFYPPVSTVPIWQIIGAGALLLTVTVLAIRAARRNGYILVGWLWYLGMLVPVIGLVQAGSQSHADRYTYLPQIGLYLLLTWAAADWCARWRHRRVALGGVATLILAALIFCAPAQTACWQNGESLWTHTLACTSDNADAQNGLGNALFLKGRDGEAMVHLQQALQINPRYAEAHDNLGSELFLKGQVDGAIVQFQQALQIDPRNADAHYNLGCALLLRGRLDEAIVQFQQALQINPDNANSHINLGNALLQMGRDDEAIVHYQRAQQLNPNSLEVQNNLAWVLATASQAALRDGRQAVALAERANQSAGGENPIFLHTLAAAYAEAGRFDDAVRTAQRAMVLAQTAGQSDLAGRLNDELKLYAAKLPFHQGSN